jgi:hypothetical protein
MTKKTTRSTLLALGLLPLSFFSEGIRAEASNDGLRSTRLVAELNQGTKTGGNLDLLMPLFGDNSKLFYGDIQAYQYGSEYRTLGLGIGQRQIWGEAIYGVYGFFDRQISSHKIYYNRVNIGLERLGLTWNFRTNFYAYLNAKKTNIVDQGITNGFVQGNNILYTHLYEIEKVYNGADVEIGRTLGSDKLRGYVGYYNFDNTIKGPKARIQYQVNERLGINLNTQDDVRGNLTYLGVNYWFGKTTLPGANGISDRMLEPVVRDMTVAAKITDSYIEYDTDPRSIYFANPTATTGAGTQSNPMSLQQAFATAKNNDIIYMLHSDQAFDLGGEDLTITSGQTLLSSASSIYGYGSLSNIKVLSGDPTQHATFKNGGLNITGAATLDGIHLEGSTATNNLHGINITGDEPVTLSNINISGFTVDSYSAGINISGNSTVTFNNVTSNANNHGLIAQNGKITIKGTANSFSHNLGSGIKISDNAGLILLENADISDNGGNGIYFDGTNPTLTITSVTVNHNGNNGLYADKGAITINGVSNSFSDNFNNGINIRNLANLSTLKNADVSDNGTTTESDGIYLADANYNTILDSVTVNGNGANGLEIYAGDITITGAGNSFSHNAFNGIVIGSLPDTTPPSLVSLANADASNNGFSGISLDGANNSITLTSVIANSNGENGLYVLNGMLTIASTSNSFSHNGDTGINIIDGSPSLVSAENVDASYNGGSGIYLGTSNSDTTLTSITADHNGTATINFDSSKDGLIVKNGTITIGGTGNSFSYNANGAGINIADGGAQLISLANADVSYNGTDSSCTDTCSGIYLGSGNYNTAIDSLTAESNGNTEATYADGLRVQSGTVTITGTSNLSSNYRYAMYAGGNASVTANLGTNSTLQGVIRVATDLGYIIIHHGGNTYAPPRPGSLTCNISGDTGACL